MEGSDTGRIVTTIGAPVSIRIGASDTGDVVFTIGAPVSISIGTGVIGDSDTGDTVSTIGAPVSTRKIGTGVIVGKLEGKPEGVVEGALVDKQSTSPCSAFSNPIILIAP